MPTSPEPRQSALLGYTPNVSFQNTAKASGLRSLTGTLKVGKAHGDKLASDLDLQGRPRSNTFRNVLKTGLPLVCKVPPEHPLYCVLLISLGLPEGEPGHRVYVPEEATKRGGLSAFTAAARMDDG